MYGYANRISFPTLPEHDHIGWWIATSRSWKYHDPDGLCFVMAVEIENSGVWAQDPLVVSSNPETGGLDRRQGFRG